MRKALLSRASSSIIYQVVFSNYVQFSSIRIPWWGDWDFHVMISSSDNCLCVLQEGGGGHESVKSSYGIRLYHL